MHQAEPGLPVTVTLKVRGMPEPHELFAVTEIFPPFAPGVAVIDVEAELPLQPDGNVHVYDVAPATEAMLYVCETPWHTVVFPVIAPGWAGIAVTDTLNVRGVPEPHELFAVTEILPLFAPGVAVIDVEAELPLHPDGNVHVYDVAPFTAVILYVWEAPWHTVVLPVIAPGWAGIA